MLAVAMDDVFEENWMWEVWVMINDELAAMRGGQFAGFLADGRMSCGDFCDG